MLYLITWSLTAVRQDVRSLERLVVVHELELAIKVDEDAAVNEREMMRSETSSQFKKQPLKRTWVQ